MSDLLADLEARRAEFRNLDRERQLSVNNWIGDVREACAAVHASARAGLLQEETSAWLDVAAYALGRCEVLQELIDRQEAAGGTQQSGQGSGEGLS